jgi:hypothetical protein
MQPLALSDTQLAIIKTFAAPLNSHQRSAYLQRVAQLLRGHDLEDGHVHRVARITQAELLRPSVAIDGRR